MKKFDECAGQFVKDIDFSKIKSEESERSFVCSKTNKGEVLELHEKVWNCAKLNDEDVKTMNDKIGECMKKKAREEEEEFKKKKA